MTMTFLIRIGLSLMLLFTAATVSAAKLYKHVDKDGRVTYRDQPPAGGGSVEERVIQNRPQSDAVVLPEVVMYVSKSCDPCDLARIYFKHRGVSVTEKDATDDLNTQAELKKTAGVLTVPTIVIGKTVLKGFDKSQVDGALDGAGFPKGGENKEAAKPADRQDQGGQAPTQ
jgi:glutaredoxin